MPTPQKPIEDAIIALATDNAGLYGEPFFHSASCELEHMQAEDLAEELTKLGYEVVVVDDFTVSWDGPADEYHIGSHPPAGHTHIAENSRPLKPTTRTLRVRLGTDEDLARDFGSSRLQIGFPVTPTPPTEPSSRTRTGWLDFIPTG